MDSTEQQSVFGEWVERHSRIIYRVVNGFASGEDRNDLLQEVLLAVWKSIPSFRKEAKATTYLYRVCHNAALLWMRGEKRYRRHVEELSEFSLGTDAGARSAMDERLAEVYGAIRKLKAMDRSLVLLSLDGLNYREMAEVSGLSESHVGVKLNRIRNQLSELLKGDRNEPK